MKMCFRWFGDNDPVKIGYIAQIPKMHGIVSAVYDVPVGGIWSEQSILHIKNRAEAAGLAFEVVESVPVHEDIKLGKPARDRLIENYIENLKRLSKHGVKCVCYNFMPVFDWTRTQLDKRNKDGSSTLVFYGEQLKGREILSLPGWDSSYKKQELHGLLADYKALGHNGLWANLEHFLKAVIPAAEVCGINMAIHPDDPPWDIFGIPRVITNRTSIKKLLSIVDSSANGLTFCTGSLGCADFNDVVQMADEFSAAGRIHFMHVRNVKILQGGFEETAHPSCCGSLDIAGVLRALKNNGFSGYVRPDHGRMIWGEKGKPGYGLYDRALGAAYLNGLWEGLS